ncbi:MAG: glucosaminidase domain-containing protein [Bacilli bacterium]|nr:glucosaminidase domain-containing protein [Bacilli bacterium]
MEVLDIMSECSSDTMRTILYSVKNILSLIQIIAPIVLIIIAAVNLSQLMISPGNKKKINAIKNSFIAAAVIFFIPMFINLVMGLVGNSTSFSDCWINANKSNRNYQYMEIGEKKKRSLFSNPNEYEKGKKQENNSSSYYYEDGEQIDGTAKQIGDVVWDPNDVTKISNLTTSQLIAALNAHGGKARNFIPYASALITAEQKYSVNVFFLIGIQATESGWITSRISQSCNNLGGVKANQYHPSNGCSSNFAYFSSVNEFIDYHARLLHNSYLTPGAAHYHGTSPSAVVTDYCPGCSSWPGTVTTIANSIFNDVARTMGG